MIRFVLVLLLTWPVFTWAETLGSLVTVADGLDPSVPENIVDDYIRLTLIMPDYQTAAQIKQQVETLLGPDMVRVESAEKVLIQAPRDSSARIEFIAWLLAMEMGSAQAQ